MPLQTVGEWILEIHKSIDGIVEAIPGEPRGALSRTPTICHIMRRFTNKIFSSTAAREYVFNVFVYLDNRDAQASERQTWQILDNVLDRWAAATKADGQLQRGVSLVPMGDCLFSTIGGVPYRVIVFQLTINEHVNAALTP